MSPNAARILTLGGIEVRTQPAKTKEEEFHLELNLGGDLDLRIFLDVSYMA